MPVHKRKYESGKTNWYFKFLSAKLRNDDVGAKKDRFRANIWSARSLFDGGATPIAESRLV